MGQAALASRLEARLAGHGAVRDVCVNPLTGNLLITFDVSRIDVAALVTVVARHVRDTRSQGAPGPPSTRGDSWHASPAHRATEALGVNPQRGLSTGTAEERLARIGPNYLPTPSPRSSLSIVADHLTSLPVLLLGGAAALSVASGAVVDAVVILAVVAANAVVGYVTESRVERVLTSLQNSTVTQALVRRDGRDLVVPARAVVPGDVVVLKNGRDVPADARLVAVDGLAMDESALTGESMPVGKSASAVVPAEAALASRTNMVYAGTVVSSGSGLAVVVGTGPDTEIGRIRALVGQASAPPTPLEHQLDRMGRRLVVVSLGFCGITLGLGLLRGVPALEMIRTAISLAVAAVPEGLPAVATTTLALGMQRMMRRQTLVRRLAAVEGLGATTVICVDKTGTLTENRMTVRAWFLGGHEFRVTGRRSNGHHPGAPLDARLRRALEIGVLCNEADVDADSSEIRGSSTEGALLQAALDAGLDHRLLRHRYRLRDVRPRTDGENWMGTVHQNGAGGCLVTVKGAPEEVLARATSWLRDGHIEPLTLEARARILDENAHMADGGMRVLGLAYAESEESTAETYRELTWVGLVGFSDPLRTGVREAMLACRRAGIRAVILTGDQARTAAAIYRELAPSADRPPRILDASRLGSLDPALLPRLVDEVDVFARVSPADKYRIVRALQASGHVVAMTGDGINDAAALRAADIGIAMGARGTDVARDVADVVLLDDDFGSIVRAVEQGRTIHANIRKTLKFLLSTNFSEIIVTLAALAVGVARPMSAIQFLWINLLSDVLPALALAVEPPAPNVMVEPPRNPAEPILSPAVLGEIGRDAAVLAASTLAAHGIALARYGPGARATTVAFTSLTAAQLVHALDGRARSRGGLVGLGASPLLLGVVGGSLAVQLAAVTAPPLQRLLGTTSLSLMDALLVTGAAAIPFAVRGLRPATSSVAAAPPDWHASHPRWMVGDGKAESAHVEIEALERSEYRVNEIPATR
jgi:Ca2+-transporting ATPase